MRYTRRSAMVYKFRKEGMVGESNGKSFSHQHPCVHPMLMSESFHIHPPPHIALLACCAVHIYIRHLL